MSTQAQHMGGQAMWDHPQFVFKQPLQLEEHPYSLDTTPSAKYFPQQRQISSPSLNAPPSAGRYGSYPSAIPFGTSSGFVRPPSMSTSSFNPLNGDTSLALDTSSASFGQSSHSPHVSPGYNQQRLEPNQAPEGSPNPNSAVANQSSHSYLPPGPLQFPPPLPLPSRQSEIQAHYFNAAPHARTQQDSLPNPKRSKPSDDYDDGQGEQPDTQEQEAVRPKPSVDLALPFLV